MKTKYQDIIDLAKEISETHERDGISLIVGIADNEKIFALTASGEVQPICSMAMHVLAQAKRKESAVVRGGDRPEALS